LKKYNSDNHYLKFNIDYAPHSNKYDNSFITDFIKENKAPSSSSRHNLQDLKNTTYSARLDYSQPLGENSLYEVGWKGSYFFIDNKLNNDTLANDTWVKDGNTSNDFQYTQHVEAAYITFASKIKKFEYKLGLRTEYTYTKADQKTNTEIKKKNYFHLFPTAFLSYAMNDKNVWRGSFSSRIERPNDHDVNSFYNKYIGAIDEINLDTKGSSWTANSRHTLTFTKGWRIEALGYYKSSVVNGARKTAENYGLDLALEKKIWDDRGMVKLATNGIVRNARPTYSTTFNDLHIIHQNFPDNRKVLLSLHYRFGS